VYVTVCTPKLTWAFEKRRGALRRRAAPADLVPDDAGDDEGEAEGDDQLGEDRPPVDRSKEPHLEAEAAERDRERREEDDDPENRVGEAERVLDLGR